MFSLRASEATLSTSSLTLLLFPDRIIVGAFHGIVNPALFFLFNNWFPKIEQVTALSTLLLGNALGLIINVPIVAGISKLDMSDGWTILFYGGSFLHLVWLVLCFHAISDRPESHPFIGDKEVSYIRQNSNNILEEVTRWITGNVCTKFSLYFIRTKKFLGKAFFVREFCMFPLWPRFVGASTMLCW